MCRRSDQQNIGMILALVARGLSSILWMPLIIRIYWTFYFLQTGYPDLVVSIKSPLLKNFRSKAERNNQRTKIAAVCSIRAEFKVHPLKLCHPAPIIWEYVQVYEYILVEGKNNSVQIEATTGHLVKWYDSHFGCERSWALFSTTDYQNNTEPSFFYKSFWSSGQHWKLHF